MRALIKLHQILLDSSSHCLTFDYHMYGSWVGTLNVYTLDNSGTKSKIFKANGNQGTQWINAAIEIPAMQGLQVCTHYW